MSNKDRKIQEQNDRVQKPKRGRPSGKNRVPLSLEERRARNAQYERERRNETADALAQLAEALGQNASMSSADLIATAISQIQRATATSTDNSLDDLKRINANLESQIASLSSRLGLDAAGLELLDEGTDEEVSQARSQKEFEAQKHQCCDSETSSRRNNKRKRSSQTTHQRKRPKLQIPYSDVDSGIESQSPTYDQFQNVENVQCHQTSTTQSPSPGEYFHSASPVQFDLQSELYSQLYRSEQGATSWNSDGTLPPYCIENIAQSLFTVPTICPPQQETLDWRPEPTQESVTNMVQEVVDTEYVDLQNASEILPEVASALEMLTETEKGILGNLINENFLQENNTNETPVRKTYTTDNYLLSRYLDN